MRTTLLNIHVCFGHTTLFIAQFDCVQYQIFIFNDIFDAVDNGVATRTFMHFEFVSFVQQIINFFIVDFDVADTAQKIDEQKASENQSCIHRQKTIKFTVTNMIALNRC